MARTKKGGDYTDMRRMAARSTAHGGRGSNPSIAIADRATEISKR
jgi:hypothetical protein